ERGNAGFVFVTRIAFADILAGDEPSVDTLSLAGAPAGRPPITRLGDVERGAAPLDLSTQWLDVATLSSNKFHKEHEISKLGSVAAEQIEGILVVRLPAA